MAAPTPDWRPPATLDELYAKTAGNRFHALNSDTAGAREPGELPVAPVAVNLYSLGTPNGQKVSILLEELGVEYAAHRVNLAGEQFREGFVKGASPRRPTPRRWAPRTDDACAVNPNSKIPAVLHNGTTRVFESGAILIYLAETRKSSLLPAVGDPKRAECLSWVMWQMAGQGPMTGNFGHFFVYAPRDKHEALEYGVARYGMEVRRLLSVLETHLADERRWILGDDYSVADVACYPWTETVQRGYRAGDFIGVTSGRYPRVAAWMQRMRERPAVQRGMRVLSMAGDKGARELADLNAKHTPAKL